MNTSNISGAQTVAVIFTDCTSGQMHLTSTLAVNQYLPLRLLVDMPPGKLTAARATIKNSAQELGLKNQVFFLLQMRKALRHIVSKV